MVRIRGHDTKSSVKSKRLDWGGSVALNDLLEVQNLRIVGGYDRDGEVFCLVREFRDEAQLIIVSHQKRTMETGDALYGVTMAPGGSSQVLSQKVAKEPEGASS